MTSVTQAHLAPLARSGLLARKGHLGEGGGSPSAATAARWFVSGGIHHTESVYVYNTTG